MDGTIDFIVLEHDDVAGCALIAGAVDGVVPAIDGHNTPYVVAMGYDHATRNWEDCTLYDDIVKAKLTYEGLRGRGYPLDGAMRRDDSATLDIRGLTDAELAIEIEKVRAFAGSSPVVRAFVEPLCAYIPEPSDSVREAKRDISPYLRQTAQRCQRISHPIDPDESASSARCATFGGAAALPAHRGYKHR